MHEAAPIRWDDTRGCWDVFGYDAVQQVAADYERFSSRMDANPDYLESDGRSLLHDSMLHADPSRHDELRSVVNQLFRPSELATLQSFIHQRTDDLLNAAVTGESGEARATFDLVPEVAYPLTVRTLTKLLGVPPTDRDAFLEWTKFTDTAPYEVDDAATRLSSLLDYLDGLLDGRPQDSQEEFLSAVRSAAGLSRAERRSILSVILLGGLSTTHLIDNSVWSLTEVDGFETVRSDRDALIGAIEETLRYRSPVRAASRYATATTDVGGATVEPGDKLCLWFAAANRDPTVFDTPGQFILDRRPTDHLAFGHGTHFCLGASLARLIARTALDVFFERFEEITVHCDQAKPTGSMLVYGPSTLPVTVA
ncbi:hypothetical protein AUR64_04295 [Haloprofundus marisrubri]|uniref:Cytochrome n=2 Tax=Haloprofundus marisrubri TaxID=1514971 RepID=A0A0W1RDH2_9EURY|nr:hypothetical protein AUR64_04295 [Haloprofundus marisrubri]